jgi:hypothetical protein
VDEFADVAKARATYALFADAMSKGRDILVRAGIASAPPPVPDFDAVFRRLNANLRETLYADLRTVESLTTEEALRIWQPLLKRAFGAAPRS